MPLEISLYESHYYMAKYAQMIFMKDIISNEEIKKYYQKYIQLARKKKIINTTGTRCYVLPEGFAGRMICIFLLSLYL